MAISEGREHWQAYLPVEDVGHFQPLRVQDFQLCQQTGDCCRDRGRGVGCRFGPWCDRSAPNVRFKRLIVAISSRTCMGLGRHNAFSFGHCHVGGRVGV